MLVDSPYYKVKARTKILLIIRILVDIENLGFYKRFSTKF